MLTANKIAQYFDDRAQVSSGYLEGQFAFQVSILGGEVGYIVPPLKGGAWKLDLCEGAHEMRGYYLEEEGEIIFLCSL
jgi:hypothetical protein